MTELINPTPWTSFIPRPEGHPIYSSAPAVEAVRAIAPRVSPATDNASLVLVHMGCPSTSPRRSPELDRLRELPEDWDGEGASRVIDTAIDAAERLISTLPVGIRKPDAGANPNGTVSLYWKTPVGKGELEIGRSRYSWVFIPQGRRQDAVTQSGEVSRLTSGALVRFWRHLGGRSVFSFNVPTADRYVSTEVLRNRFVHADTSGASWPVFLCKTLIRGRSGE